MFRSALCVHLCMYVQTSLHLIKRGRVRGKGLGWGWCFVASGHPQCSVVCTAVRGLNAGVIKEQLQGCMDTRQSRPNEVSIDRIGAHAWTKAS